MNRHTRNSRFHTVALMAMAASMSSCCVSAAGTSTTENPTGTSAVAAREPVSYLVKEKSLIGNEMFEAGTTALYAGLPAENLEPTCDVGRARAAEYHASNRARVATMIETHKESAVGDPQKFMADFIKAQAQQAEEQSIQIASAVGQAVAAAMAKYFPAGAPAAAPTAEAAPAIAATEATETGTTAEGPTKRTKT